MTVATGLDRITLDSNELVRNRRIGLLAHPASVDRDFQPAPKVLSSQGANIIALFGPEHGFAGQAQDMEGVETSAQAFDGIKLFSLYGNDVESLKPTPEMLEGIELFVVDLQDVGARYYTYVWTAALCLEVCASENIPMLVLDRPNPLGCHIVEGPGISPGYHSFVGLHNIPTVHGLTIGEILKLYDLEHNFGDGCLEVLKMHGYSRQHSFEETGLPWVMPSPNMPTRETAQVYPGMCLFEGTNISEGRGTTRPFEIIGAPWINGDRLARKLDQEDLPGCRFRPLEFKPTFHKYSGQKCGGIQTHVTNPSTFRPLRVGVAALKCIFDLSDGENFQFREQTYEFVSDRLAIDLLAGGPWLREGIEKRLNLHELCETWSQEEQAFELRKKKIVAY